MCFDNQNKIHSILEVILKLDFNLPFSPSFFFLLKCLFLQLLSTVLLELNNQDLKDSKLSDEFYLLSNLRKTDPAKIIKLQERLAPSRFGGPCPAPTFPGRQEFFRDFLRSCGGNSIFIAHLKITLVSTITKICENPFVENQLFETGSNLDSSSSCTYPLIFF